MFGIVYGLENNFDHKIYIGQSHRTLEERFREHKCANSLIGRAIRKYGEENFVKVILEECENQEQLDACEISWIARLNSMFPNGYNLSAGGKGTLGHKQSDETRAKMSAARKGKPSPNKGKPSPKKGKPSPKRGIPTGRKTPPEVKAKLSAKNKGQKRSTETRQKMSLAKKGRIVSMETRAKLSEVHKGKKYSPERCAKMSAAKKAYWARIKNK